MQAIEAHESEILCVAFSPSTETLLVTGSSDNVSPLRYMKALPNLRSLTYH